MGGELFERENMATKGDAAQKVIGHLRGKIGKLHVERDFLARHPAISQLLRGWR